VRVVADGDRREWGVWAEAFAQWGDDRGVAPAKKKIGNNSLIKK